MVTARGETARIVAKETMWAFLTTAFFFALFFRIVLFSIAFESTNRNVGFERAMDKRVEGCGFRTIGVDSIGTRPRGIVFPKSSARTDRYES